MKLFIIKALLTNCLKVRLDDLHLVLKPGLFNISSVLVVFGVFCIVRLNKPPRTEASCHKRSNFRFPPSAKTPIRKK